MRKLILLLVIVGVVLCLGCWPFGEDYWVRYEVEGTAEPVNIVFNDGDAQHTFVNQSLPRMWSFEGRSGDNVYIEVEKLGIHGNIKATIFKNGDAVDTASSSDSLAVIKVEGEL